LPASLSCGLIVTDVAASRGVDCEVPYALVFVVCLLMVVVGRGVKPDSLTGRLECGSESILDPIQCTLPACVTVAIRRSIWRRGN
jgi:hypothetical protein